METSLSHRHQFAQLWLLLAGIVVFAFYVVFDRSYLQTMFQVDESYLSSVILIAFVCASGMRPGTYLRLQAASKRGSGRSVPVRRSMVRMMRNQNQILCGTR